MAIVWLDVTVAFPSDISLAALPVATQNDILAQVNDEEIKDATWPSAAKANRARRYLAAHLGSIASGLHPGAYGPVQSERVGEVARVFSLKASQNPNSLNSTTYGDEYLRLIRNSFGGPWVP